LSSCCDKNGGRGGGASAACGVSPRGCLDWCAVYPTLDERTGELITADKLRLESTVLQHLYDYIFQRGTIVPLVNYNR
jgi:hypothetical protein